MASRPSRRRHAALRRGPGGIAWFALLVVVILGGGALLANLKHLQDSAEAHEREVREAERRGSRPFAEMPPEERPPWYKGDGEGQEAEPAPPPFRAEAAELSDDPLWLEALALADEGQALYLAAIEAKRVDDIVSLNEKGNAAKAKLDQALELTAGWEEELLAERGEQDPLVRGVQALRNTWFDRLRWLHKSTSR